MTPTVAIDHVEIFVPDRYEAAAWYRDVLGLAILTDFEHWASDPRGPLMISGDEGSSKIALFTGNPSQHGSAGGFYQLAFRLSGTEFNIFLSRALDLQLKDRNGQASKPVDHEQSFSIYFLDPWGHCLEVTTYDVEDVRKPLT